MKMTSATEAYREFLKTETLRDAMEEFKNTCELCDLDPRVDEQFYQKLKDKLPNVDPALWRLLDKRAGQEEYLDGTVCTDKKVLIVGAGPCGLRMAMECVFLGAHVVVVEMRDYFSRNNVLHLWPCVIDDLKKLGAKIFFPQFCVGGIEHINIRRLQLILFKLCLILGVEFYTPVQFLDVVQPDPQKGHGWRAKLEPKNCPVASMDFDVIVGAEGKKHTLNGFAHKVHRGRLAIAITANLVNLRTKKDALVREIGGLWRIFAPQFFDDLREQTYADLENIVYFKDETHYFVMTPKKKCLLETGVIKEDKIGDPRALLHPSNVDRDKLLQFIRNVTSFATKGELADAEFSVTHHGTPDAAIFDFTAMTMAVNVCFAQNIRGNKLLTCIVGDAALEPFWPQGTGAARGFLGVFDSAWLLRNWFLEEKAEQECLAEREALFSMLSQTSPKTLKSPVSKYTIDPKTRYPSIPQLKTEEARSLYITDGTTDNSENEVKRENELPDSVVELIDKHGEEHVTADEISTWYNSVLGDGISITDMETWCDGVLLLTLLHKYKPQLVDVKTLDATEAVENCRIAFYLIEKHLNLTPILKPEDLSNGEADVLVWLTYLALLKGKLENLPQRRRSVSKLADDYESLALEQRNRQPSGNDYEKIQVLRNNNDSESESSSEENSSDSDKYEDCYEELNEAAAADDPWVKSLSAYTKLNARKSPIPDSGGVITIDTKKTSTASIVFSTGPTDKSEKAAESDDDDDNDDDNTSSSSESQDSQVMDSPQAGNRRSISEEVSDSEDEPFYVDSESTNSESELEHPQKATVKRKSTLKLVDEYMSKVNQLQDEPISPDMSIKVPVYNKCVPENGSNKTETSQVGEESNDIANSEYTKLVNNGGKQMNYTSNYSILQGQTSDNINSEKDGIEQRNASPYRTDMDVEYASYDQSGELIRVSATEACESENKLHENDQTIHSESPPSKHKTSSVVMRKEKDKHMQNTQHIKTSRPNGCDKSETNQDDNKGSEPTKFVSSYDENGEIIRLKKDNIDDEPPPNSPVARVSACYDENGEYMLPIEAGFTRGGNKRSSVVDMASKIDNGVRTQIKKYKQAGLHALYCTVCEQPVYFMGSVKAFGQTFHKNCFKCKTCDVKLRIDNAHVLKETEQRTLLCKKHYFASGVFDSAVHSHPRPLHIRQGSTSPDNDDSNTTDDDNYDSESLRLYLAAEIQSSISELEEEEQELEHRGEILERRLRTGDDSKELVNEWLGISVKTSKLKDKEAALVSSTKKLEELSNYTVTDDSTC